MTKSAHDGDLAQQGPNAHLGRLFGLKQQQSFITDQWQSPTPGGTKLRRSAPPTIILISHFLHPPHERRKRGGEAVLWGAGRSCVWRRRCRGSAGQHQLSPRRSVPPSRWSAVALLGCSEVAERWLAVTTTRSSSQRSVSMGTTGLAMAEI
jgi:hypothetical protein